MRRHATPRPAQAYLDLQKPPAAKAAGTQELLTLYVLECWLARAGSRYADHFILKGGMLLAAFNTRRPTADADALTVGFPATRKPS